MITPRADKILVEVEELKPKGGIILARDDLVIERATVISVGPDVKEIKVGDKVLYKTWALDTVEIGDEKYPFLSEEHVLAVYAE